ncbi:hypothetical protein OsJ_06468 [Oryza sativa Japonica Group]|uniref:Uncharacterized protein n=1 Tax=Oryza sativa subsp. japonica TaxID=39947 RepID=B9F5C0_ORYSJ|nr:hypothetical protein OsJ_06468 [Oryza sativa Japonica Group]
MVAIAVLAAATSLSRRQASMPLPPNRVHTVVSFAPTPGGCLESGPAANSTPPRPPPTPPSHRPGSLPPGTTDPAMGEQDPCILAPDLDTAIGSSSTSAPGPELCLAGTPTALTASEGERAPLPPCL